MCTAMCDGIYSFFLDMNIENLPHTFLLNGSQVFWMQQIEFRDVVSSFIGPLIRNYST